MKRLHLSLGTSRSGTQLSIQAGAVSSLPTPWGAFRIHGFKELGTNREHLALTLDGTDDSAPILCRVHSECLTGDAFLSLRCDCGPQLRAALSLIGAEGRGVVVYLRQEGRGIGLLNKVHAYALQDAGLDTVEANLALGFEEDARRYKVAAEILQSLDVRRIRLLTNNPAKVPGLNEMGVQVVERVPLLAGRNSHNERYMHTKAVRLGHVLAA